MGREADESSGDGSSEFEELDPTGRYGRYKELLGAGSVKKVYKGFDNELGIEVAWNQVAIAPLAAACDGDACLDRLRCEVDLLGSLNHRNIIHLYASWVDHTFTTVNFITEILTSGTLRQYREKHRRICTIALKKWAKQILRGLLYLHGHDPPIIHRDLKCDNIFINGNDGEVKIGDLGLATVLRGGCVLASDLLGTPGFMAPEMYEEQYDELVDVYAFGMCILEMITLEHPYSECTGPTREAQIMKKVLSGKKPAALKKVVDPEARNLIELCLLPACKRPQARELLDHPFVHCTPPPSPPPGLARSFTVVSETGTARGGKVTRDGSETHEVREGPGDNKHSRDAQGDDAPASRAQAEEAAEEYGPDIVKLQLNIPGRLITFPFNLKSDSPFEIANELVKELDLPRQEVETFANLISVELLSLA